MTTGTATLFARAATVFDGWTDPATGARVLCLFRRGERAVEDVWQTPYQHCPCFLDGGRRVLLRTGRAYAGFGGKTQFLLDLADGSVSRPFPGDAEVYEVNDAGGTALLFYPAERRYTIFEVSTGRELAALTPGDWPVSGFYALAGGRGALLSCHNELPYRAPAYSAPVRSRLYLLAEGAAPCLLLEEEQTFVKHMQGHPSDPRLFAYDRFPSPKDDAVAQVIHLRHLDEGWERPLPLDPRVPRPGNFWGVRDHYLWTPDGKRIVSYFVPQPFEIGPDFNHFRLEWWLSATDWQTGEDLAAAYPPGRWGCHMGVSPDGRWVVSAGGPGFDFLYATEIEGLRRGWNERILCAYPTTVSMGNNVEPFAFPFVLPDGSGVVFNAGWPGPEHGVYLAEWPADA